MLCEILLPLAINKTYTYLVPKELEHAMQFGIRAEVQFGKSKLYSGLVIGILNDPEHSTQLKPILSVLDAHPIITQQQYEFWQWIAKYYLCNLGEVMNAAIPSGLKLSSDSAFVKTAITQDIIGELQDDEFLVMEALETKPLLNLKEIQLILGRKSVSKVIQSLMSKNIIGTYEKLEEKYKPKKYTRVQFSFPKDDNKTLEKYLDDYSKFTSQTDLLLRLYMLLQQQKFVSKKDLRQHENFSVSSYNTLIKKGVIVQDTVLGEPVADSDPELTKLNELSAVQQTALAEIEEGFASGKPVLLHGVTGSGKTRIYVELIKAALEKNQQILYLLPEIAISSQLIGRLKAFFGNKITEYHSRKNTRERVESWKEVQAGKPLIVGVRSSIFLPFQNLGLIIIDESHDNSLKQHEPAPRYHARDSALAMAHFYDNAQVILGTATPSIESLYNHHHGKIHRVELTQRHGDVMLPELELVDLKKARADNELFGSYSKHLLDAITACLANEEQIILFQNRRGFVPHIQCENCAWIAQCKHCDVSLTYHKYAHSLNCHYCGRTYPMISECPKCEHIGIGQKGLGTEKIESELQEYFPKARIKRMDLDTVRKKHAHGRIIREVENRKIDILVGTQMVTKGLDFSHIGLVAIVDADHHLFFPDFRANEKAFQTFTQVGGRAGRLKKGRFIIQTYAPTHPVFDLVKNNDCNALYDSELESRKTFNYPPFVRLIEIEIKHPKVQIVESAAAQFAQLVKNQVTSGVNGPFEPSISRIRSYYIRKVLVKHAANKQSREFVKAVIWRARRSTNKISGLSTVRIIINVDPT